MHLEKYLRKETAGVVKTRYWISSFQRLFNKDKQETLLVEQEIMGPQ
jgi:hypothetical protein